jgi:hypothetical protein
MLPYRQDEILAVIRVLDDFGVDRHIPARPRGLARWRMPARHGAMASLLRLGRRFEVYDAIPYNGALIRGRDVTRFNR